MKSLDERMEDRKSRAEANSVAEMPNRENLQIAAMNEIRSKDRKDGVASALPTFISDMRAAADAAADAAAGLTAMPTPEDAKPGKKTAASPFSAS